MLKQWRQWRQRRRLLRERRAIARDCQTGSNLLHDPIEDDPQLHPSFLRAEQLVDEELVGVERGMGFCHRYWRVKQRILRERFQIDWYSPSDMNPMVLFD